MSDLKCAACPCRDLSHGCHAVAGPHPRLCALVDPGHPDHDPRYAEVARDWCERFRHPADLDRRPPGAYGGCGAVAPTADRPPRDRTPYADPRPLVWECDYRGGVLEPACGCAGEVRHCGLARGFFATAPFEVRMGDCLACVKGRR